MVIPIIAKYTEGAIYIWFAGTKAQSVYEAINKVGDIAETENHHPDIIFGWGYAKIKIFTHKIQGLIESDFILAAKIDKIKF